MVFGIGVDPLLARGQRQAVHVHAEVGIAQDGEFVHLRAHLEDRRHLRVDEAADGVGIAAHQHRRHQLRRDELPVDLDVLGVGRLQQDRQRDHVGGVGRRGDALAVEVLRRTDVGLGLQADERDRRDVERDVVRLQRLAGVERGVLHHHRRVDVADVVRAARHGVGGVARAGAAVDLDGEAFLLEVALLLGDEERRVRALHGPVEHHLDVGAFELGVGRRGGPGDHRGKGAAHDRGKGLRTVHATSWLIDWVRIPRLPRGDSCRGRCLRRLRSRAPAAAHSARTMIENAPPCQGAHRPGARGTIAARAGLRPCVQVT